MPNFTNKHTSDYTKISHCRNEIMLSIFFIFISAIYYYTDQMPVWASTQATKASQASEVRNSQHLIYCSISVK